MNEISNDILRHKIINFINLEFDLNDNILLEFNIQTLREKIKCDFLLLKILITRLRRVSSSEDFNLFKIILNKNLDLILKYNHKHHPRIFPSRWLVSFLDTYIDLGDDVESRNGLIAVQFQKNEKCMATIHDLYQLLKKEPYIHSRKGKDFASIHITGESDQIKNFLNRLKRKLIETPTIFLIFKELLKRSLLDEESMYSILLKDCKEKIFKEPLRNFLNEKI